MSFHSDILKSGLLLQGQPELRLHDAELHVHLHRGPLRRLPQQVGRRRLRAEQGQRLLQRIRVHEGELRKDVRVLLMAQMGNV